MTFPATQNPWPVRYKLVSATYHIGNTVKFGHYAAGVTGPKLPRTESTPQYHCNDTAIRDWTDGAHPNVISMNPAVCGDQKDCDVSILFYTRIPRERGKLMPYAGETIADRLRNGTLSRRCRK
ncbi:uncharacterized protein K460DRAFT_365660 [Cucurbitaria berberidis CBS 394.84]|uniref:Uncharacterized protein n=1 Tax=Cucurbitaria berberidis CBS 394.84 TaxID=1168544 RepID=A0A9P4L799_9PLEO|nr:uncharacterized protein K460DRAFT_365660 [Cucurbitaria berberidis CBS 394.84]KAF1844715.1 hypothetical protein K460DRAFT_365660 [Cucurbitaria berberidis CBS 394.84]